MSRVKKLFFNLSIRLKLILLIGIFLGSIVILALAVNLMFKSSQTMTIIVSEDRVFIENYSFGKEYFLRYEISQEEEDLMHSLDHFKKAVDVSYYFVVTDSIISAMEEEEWKPLLYDIFKEGIGYDMDKLELLTSQIKLFNMISPGRLNEVKDLARTANIKIKAIVDDIQKYVANDSTVDFADIESKFDEMHEFSSQFSEVYDSLSNFMNRMTHIVIGLLILILGGLATIISLMISKSISQPINTLANDFKRMAKGDLKPSVVIESENEIGDLSKAFYEIQIGLQNVVSHAKKIAQGDYTARLKRYSDKDELTLSLNQMAERLEESQIRSDHEHWLQKGLSELDDQMRGNFTVRELSDRIIVFLSQFLNAEMGAVYVYDDVLDHLEMLASVGMNVKEVPQIVQLGDGLIGGATKKEDCQIIDAKDKFKTIYSATGEIYPEKIYLMPMFFGGSIQAVIELAAINSLPEKKLDFLKLIKDRVSVNLHAAVARFRNKELLDQSIEQAEILKARDEELSQKLEENQLISESLSRETALLDSMMHALPDFIYFKDIESRFIRISDSLAELFSVNSTKDVIGKTDFDFFPRKEAKHYFDEEQKIIKTGEGIVDEVRKITDENDEEAWTSVTKLPMFDDNGNCIGTFGISKDVTNIKKLEIEVNLQNEKLKQGQEELKAINEELHAQEEELRVANEELAEQTKILVESEKNLQVQQEELRVANEDLESKTEILEKQKEEILVNNDNLEKARKELEKKAKELELASQYKSEFLANMSHELRTPLNSMLILSKLLGDNKKKNLTDDQLKSISIIHNSGKDLLELINEILDLSKIEAGKMNFDFEKVYSDDIVDEVKTNFTPVAQNRNLSLKIEKSDDFPETIYSDRQRLMQVIKNLLSNAFKFTSKGGVTVKLGVPSSSHKFANTELNQNNTYYISVEDSGVGIPKSKVDAIFEAFQQADGSISRKFGGTGLGLSISKQIIQVFGGEIHVSSIEGKGSVFTVFLPLDEKLIGKELNSESVKEEKKKEVKIVKEDVAEEDVKEVHVEKRQLPFFVEDDREILDDKTVVLIIHNDKNKVKSLIEICHKKNFGAIAASNISDGILLAEEFTPQAIIVSAALNEDSELEKLKENKITVGVPLHIVTRIEDFAIDELPDLPTPGSKLLQNETEKIETKLGNEFKQVLVVEDDPATLIAIQALFENKDIIIHEANTAGQAYDKISKQQVDCIILDLGLPDYSGTELLDKLKNNDIPIPYVIINTARELSSQELRKLQQYSDSIVIKGVKSDERLMDEVALFLHQVSTKIPEKANLNKIDDDDSVGFKGKKVLVVDDDIRNVFAMAQILEERDIEILEAENGEIAIDILKNNKDIDLVLMDVMMPVMDGYEAMETIRKTDEIADIPIIMLTAKAMKEDYQKAIDLGANDFISKPVDIDKLVSLLKIWLFK